MDVLTWLWRQSGARVMAAAALITALAGAGALPGAPAVLSGGGTVSSAYADATCHLNSAGGAIQHVIYIQFDNTHFTRDNPNVPSDLEQMPHLLNFIKSNGVLLTNHHTPLIAHTATDILTSLTGVYGDRHGVPISNSFRYFNPDGTSNLGVSFAYWTDPIYDPTTSTPTDTTYNMITPTGQNMPAPWVPYTRAGCNVGSISMANTALENTGTDIPTVFGANSPQATEVNKNPDQGYADFVGVAIHCAQGASLCSSANGGEPDVLPDEPYGYGGYMALFGHKYVAPQISPGGPLTDLNGQVITNADSGLVGFPGFDPTAAQSLSYVAAMQEHGVPVTYAYIADAHDNHAAGTAYGPGEAGYVAQLKSYDNAFATFFSRLAGDGITPSNTLFVITADEGDHFVGGPPSPANCDGVTTPCTYSHIGELDANLTGLLATEEGVTTPFKVHADAAPTFYIQGNPGAYTTVTRTLERAVGKLTAVNPITGKTDRLTNYLADPVEMKILHMVTGDAARTPSFTMFANPDYYLSTGAANCTKPCVAEEQPGDAWNHGDVAPEINTTWLSLVGPGVPKMGIDSTTWSDHTDIRPTMMALLGLRDDYTHDGRVLFEDLAPSAVPQMLNAHRETLLRLGQVYKQLNASVGQFGLDTLRIATAAMQSDTPGDSLYMGMDLQLQSISQTRDSLAMQMAMMLNGAEFGGQAIDEQQAKSLIDQGQALLDRVHGLAMSAS